MGGGVYAGVHLKLGWDSVKSLGGGTIMANCMGTMNTFFEGTDLQDSLVPTKLGSN